MNKLKFNKLATIQVFTAFWEMKIEGFPAMLKSLMSLCTGSKGMPSADVVHIWQAIFDVSLFFTTLDWEQSMDSQIGMYHNTLEME